MADLGNKPAFPHDEKDGLGGHWMTHAGMSIREYAAIKAMEGLLANDYAQNFESVHVVARMARDAADALLSELAKTPAQPTGIPDTGPTVDVRGPER